VELKCPACGSTDIRQVSVVWKDLEAGVVPPADVLDAVMVEAHPKTRAEQSLSEQRQRHLLARELAPPKKLADPAGVGACRDMATRLLLFMGGLALVIWGSIRLAAEHLRPGRILATVLGAVVLAIVMFAFIRFVSPKASFKEYERRLTAWQCMFLCVRCGNRFCQDV